MRKIGLVIPGPINYSETFLYSKVRGLINSGYKIIIYCKENRIYYPELKHRFQWALTTSNPIRSIQVLFGIIRLLLFAPINSIRFIYFNHKSDFSILQTIQQLYINGHILTGNTLDVLHFEFATMGIHRENVALAIGAKSALSLRGFDIGIFPYQHPDCYSLLFNKIDKIHTISDDLYQKALSLGLRPDIPMTKIPPAVDINKFKLRVFEKLHTPVRILTVGRLTWKKGMEYGISAMKLVKEEGIKFEYKIIGEGEYYEPIKYAIHQMELNENITLLGRKTHDEVRALLEWADIYIQPSIQEGFCNSVLEAQAMGLLCVVTDAEGLPENIVDGETGWVVPKRSSNALANQIMEIISLESKVLKRIRKSAISRVRKKYNLRGQLELFFKFYQ